MHSYTRTLIVVAYLLAAAAGLAWAQNIFEAAEHYGKLFMLTVAVLGVLFGAAGAWFGLGYRVSRNTEKISDLCDWTEDHEDLHAQRDAQVNDKLDRILTEVQRS